MDVSLKHLSESVSFHLFFDQELGQDSLFTEKAIEIASGGEPELRAFQAYSAQTGELIGTKQESERISDILEYLRFCVEDGRICLGITIVGINNDWYIHQDTPVSLGVLGTSCLATLNSMDSFYGSYFVTCNDILGWDDRKRQSFASAYGPNSLNRMLEDYCKNLGAELTKS